MHKCGNKTMQRPRGGSMVARGVRRIVFTAIHIEIEKSL